MKGKVSITTSSFARYDNTPLQLLQQAGFQVITNTFGRKLDKSETVDLCRDSIAIVAGTENYDADLLQQLKELKVISRCGTGLENIDIQAARKAKIEVYNTPDAPSLAVAELTVGLILDLLRKISLMDRKLRTGEWKKVMGELLCAKIVGVVGLGRIGRKVACLLKAMGADIFYFDPEVTGAQAQGFCRLKLEELLRKSDIVCIHVPYSRQTHHLIAAEQLSMLKPGTFLVNTSRGGVVEEEALYSALKEGRLAGAAIDVFAQEPYNGPLRELENVILTPHIGSYAKEARVKMEIQVVKNLIKGLGYSID